MIKGSFVLAIMIVLMGFASGTNWLNQEPYYLQIGSQFTTPFFRPVNLSPFEIINAPYFPLLGEAFSFSAAPIEPKTSKPTVEIRSNRIGKSLLLNSDFSGSFENNLRYAIGKSSLRIGQNSNSTTLNVPWLVK